MTEPEFVQAHAQNTNYSNATLHDWQVHPRFVALRKHLINIPPAKECFQEHLIKCRQATRLLFTSFVSDMSYLQPASHDDVITVSIISARFEQTARTPPTTKETLRLSGNTPEMCIAANGQRGATALAVEGSSSVCVNVSC